MAKFGESKFATGSQISADDLAENKEEFELLNAKPYHHPEYGDSWIFTVKTGDGTHSMFMSKGQSADRDNIATYLMNGGDSLEGVGLKKVPTKNKNSNGEVNTIFVFASIEEVRAVRNTDIPF